MRNYEIGLDGTTYKKNPSFSNAICDGFKYFTEFVWMIFFLCNQNDVVYIIQFSFICLLLQRRTQNHICGISLKMHVIL